MAGERAEGGGGGGGGEEMVPPPSSATAIATAARVRRPPIPPLTKRTFDGITDVEVCAELGRTLLDRNEELEREVHLQQNQIDDHLQQIHFLTKQNQAMKEESAVRMKFYEQLEATMFELEKTNDTLHTKHEHDKKRMQSLCENIDYLEQKCEEMSGTLETIRKTRRRQRRASGRGSATGYAPSDSSEDEFPSLPNAHIFQQRSQSLTDLREYSGGSPPGGGGLEALGRLEGGIGGQIGEGKNAGVGVADSGLDSTHSSSNNSPDLKTSESEFMDCLEDRIEELLRTKHKESHKISELQNHIRLLINDNQLLHQQLTALRHEKEAELALLRKELQLLPTPPSLRLSTAPLLSVGGDSSGTSESDSDCACGAECPSGVDVWRLGSDSLSTSTTDNHNCIDHSSGNGSHDCTGAPQGTQRPASKISEGGEGRRRSKKRRGATGLCVRCSAELNLLSLVSCIEDDEGEEEEEERRSVEEFNSLEEELASAVGSELNTPKSKRRRKVGVEEEGRSVEEELVGEWEGHRRESVGERNGGWNWSFRRPSLLDCFLFGPQINHPALPPHHALQQSAGPNSGSDSPTMGGEKKSVEWKWGAWEERECVGSVPKCEPSSELGGVSLSSGGGGGGESAEEDEEEDACLRKDRRTEKGGMMRWTAPLVDKNSAEGEETGCWKKEGSSVQPLGGKRTEMKNQKTGLVWWLAWAVGVVLGVVELTWTMLTLLFFLLTLALLPTSCSTPLLALSSRSSPFRRAAPPPSNNPAAAQRRI